jgi:hypothetical protein
MFGLLKLTTALCFAYTFLAQVHASPLSRRDVVAPHITSPDASSVWPIGTMQLVTWCVNCLLPPSSGSADASNNDRDTSDLPPDSQITNPIGQIILGFNESNSLNLDFSELNSALAGSESLVDVVVRRKALLARIIQCHLSIISPVVYHHTLDAHADYHHFVQPTPSHRDSTCTMERCKSPFPTFPLGRTT